jgi:uncharacterized protein
MNKRVILKNTHEFVKNQLGAETTGHDYWHSWRVWKNTLLIAKKEKADLFVVQLAALLHDIGDWKLHGGDESVAGKQIRAYLESQKVDSAVIEHVIEIVATLTFKGANKKDRMRTIEGEIVQDADRLEALGAIGIARSFATGQKFGNMLYDPTVKPKIHRTVEEYRKQYTGEAPTTTINHFYEKLLLLKDRMNTKTAKKIAAKRHKYMERFLEQFYAEWDGKR